MKAANLGHPLIIENLGTPIVINTEIVLNTAVQIIGIGMPEIQQETVHTAIFGVLADGCHIEGIHGTYLPTKTYSGSGYRGEQRYAQATLIYSNKSRGLFRNLKSENMVCGIFLNAWTGTANTNDPLFTYGKFANRVENFESVGCDFGFLSNGGQDGLELSAIKGTYAITGGSPNPPHLIYISGQDGSHRHIDVSGCYAFDSIHPGGSAWAYQFKGITGGIIHDLRARNTGGILSTGPGIHGMKFARFHMLDGAQTGGQGAVCIADEDAVGCVFEDFFLDLDIDERAVRVRGTRNRLRRFTIKTQRDATLNADPDIYVTATGHELDDFDVENKGAGQARGIVLVSGSGHRVRNPSVRGSQYAVAITAGATDCVIDYDPARIMPFSGRAILNTEPTTKIVKRMQRSTVTILGAGTTNLDGGLIGAAVIDVQTASAFTLSAPIAADIADGAELTIEVQNNSGGVMGAITWTNFTVLVWTNPVSGSRATIRQRYSNGSWRQIEPHVIEGPGGGATGFMMSLRPDGAPLGSAAKIHFNDRVDVGYDGTFQGAVLGDNTNAKPTRLDGNYVVFSGGRRRRQVSPGATPYSILLADDIVRPNTSSTTWGVGYANNDRWPGIFDYRRLRRCCLHVTSPSLQLVRISSS